MKKINIVLLLIFITILSCLFWQGQVHSEDTGPIVVPVQNSIPKKTLGIGLEGGIFLLGLSGSTAGLNCKLFPFSSDNWRLNIEMGSFATNFSDLFFFGEFTFYFYNKPTSPYLGFGSGVARISSGFPHGWWPILHFTAGTDFLIAKNFSIYIEIEAAGPMIPPLPILPWLSAGINYYFTK